VPVCLLIVAWRKQGPELMQALRSRQVLLTMFASSLMIGGNWLVYVYAVQIEQVFAASLGYYINPLCNVLAGTLFLGERLSARQWLASAIALAGVGVLAFGALSTLWISLTLAFFFTAYGLIRKLAPVGALVGLTIESAILTLPAIAFVGWHAATGQGTGFGEDPGTDALIALAGVVTATPLLLFAIAARRMAYSTLGFVQFLAPTIAFLLALFVLREPLDTARIVSFAIIWIAIAVFSWDLFAGRSASPNA
jgi:chloramphenicol-sensitive protein RarD